MKRWSDSISKMGPIGSSAAESQSAPPGNSEFDSRTAPPIGKEKTMGDEKALTLDELQPKPADMTWWTWITTVVLPQVMAVAEDMLGPKTGAEKKAAVLDLLAAAWRQYSPVKALIGLQVWILRSVAGRLIDKLVAEYNERGWPKPATP